MEDKIIIFNDRIIIFDRKVIKAIALGLKQLEDIKGLDGMQKGKETAAGEKIRAKCCLGEFGC